jgi:homoserine dehydrogenase
MGVDLALIGFGNVGRQFMRLLERQRARLLADHDLGRLVEPGEVRESGHPAALRVTSHPVVLRIDLLDQIAICQLGRGRVHTGYALLSDLVTIGRRRGSGPA